MLQEMLVSATSLAMNLASRPVVQEAQALAN
jgi:hypothetical protein